MLAENDVLERITHWAQRQELVRAVFLTSSRASPNARADALSDFDIVLAVTDPEPLLRDLSWQEVVGEVMVRLPTTFDLSEPMHFPVLIHTDGTKIDYCLMPLQTLEGYRSTGTLPDNFDVGYRVLLDKDSLAEGLSVPTYSAHIPRKPTQEAFDAVVEEFFWQTTYVAKSLWREEVWPAKNYLETVMRLRNLRVMLEWWVSTRETWTFRPGPFGRGLQARLPPELWTRFEQTFVGANLDDNWRALFDIVELFRDVAMDVAGHLRLAYPHRIDTQVTAYLESIKSLTHYA